MKSIIRPDRIKGILLIGVIFLNPAISQQYKDTTYLQDYAMKYDLEEGSHKIQLMDVGSDRNKSIKVLSEKGLLQPWMGSLPDDKLYRPLTDMNIMEMDLYGDQFVYLTEEALLSNAWGGKFYLRHHMTDASHFAMGDDFSALIAARGELSYFDFSGEVWRTTLQEWQPMKILYDESRKHFLLLSEGSVHIFDPQKKVIRESFTGENLTSMALHPDRVHLVIGTKEGFLTLDGDSFNITSPLNKRLPCNDITCVESIRGELWFGSMRGAFRLRPDGKYDYYASRRWLVDDHVKKISAGPDRSILVLTGTGLSRIVFTEMTLEEKANYFQEIQRLRHIRYGFSSEANLRVPGDLSTAVLRDTDNDGLWTSMYLAGELFRFGATGSPDALRNAYEAFEAMERLTGITGLGGFPSRTYEIDGYQSSDTDPDMPEDQKIWRLTDDGRWRWKSTTSSDESCGHFFVYALFAEIVPDQEWRDRAIYQLRIEMDHIIENNWYLVTWNGQITRWGRWNPEYVNNFPVSVGDRRLNSTLIVAFLQTVYHFTGDEIYRKKAYELMDQHGYLENILRPATEIGYVNGQILSDTWNHSDDEMYFLTVPALVRYAFTDELKKQYLETVRSHWEIERSEKNPLWNFIYAYVGGDGFNLDESAWWLREFPMDLVGWDVENRHRKDLTRIEPNFRKQEYTEVLPRDERPMHLHNNAYRNDGGNGGLREYPPYIYLLPYWLGRYTGAISPPVKIK